MEWDGFIVKKESDMDVVGSLFALRFYRDGEHEMVQLYIEDDNNYHLKATFNRFWLRDLQTVAESGRTGR